MWRYTTQIHIERSVGVSILAFLFVSGRRMDADAATFLLHRLHLDIRPAIPSRDTCRHGYLLAAYPYS